MQFEDLNLKERQAYVKHRTQANMHMLQSKKAKSSRSKFHLNMAQFHKNAMCELLQLFEADQIIAKLQSVGDKPKPDPDSWWSAPAGFTVLKQQVIAHSRTLRAQWFLEPTLDIEIIGTYGTIVWPKK